LLQGFVGLVYLDIEKLELIEAKYGRPYAERLLLSARTAIHELRSSYPSVFEQMMAGDDFFLYVSLGLPSMEDLYRTIEEIGDSVRLETLKRVREQYPEAPHVEVSFGYALLNDSEEKELETVLYTAMKQAIRHAKERSASPESAALLQEFHSILRHKRVIPHYQPIVSLTDGAVFGYEALTRGPELSPLRSPLRLFQLAEQADQLYALNKMTREQAILGCGQIQKHQRIFLNIPHTSFTIRILPRGERLPYWSRWGSPPATSYSRLRNAAPLRIFPR
jgi:predicted signal transduction protein with EAL and GGDEF domain